MVFFQHVVQGLSCVFFSFRFVVKSTGLCLGFPPRGIDHGWFFLDFAVFMLCGFVILFSGLFPLGFVNLCGAEVVSGSPYNKIGDGEASSRSNLRRLG